MSSEPSLCESESWEIGFRKFLRDTRAVSDDTIDSYVDYVSNVAEALHQKPEDIAKCDDGLRDVFQKIDATEWKKKTKDNYKTGVRALYVFNKAKSSGEKLPQAMFVKLREAIKSQINDLELESFRLEGAAWRTVFGIFTGYALVLPPLLIRHLASVRGILCALVSILLAFVGIGLFIPVLRKSFRQLHDIQKKGEEIVFGGSIDLWYCPKDWTKSEIWFGIGAGLALLSSVISLGAAKIIDVSVK